MNTIPEAITESVADTFRMVDMTIQKASRTQ
jgi:hypothetical protein